MPPPQDGASTNFATRAVKKDVRREIKPKQDFAYSQISLLKSKKKDVPEERLELSRDNSQRLLRPQRLPISPSGQYKGANIIF
jgi:hypothetical protein